MQMYYGQYERVESKAGGVYCTNRQFIKAAHSLLAPTGRSRAQRAARHAWIRSGLLIKSEQRSMLRKFSL